MTKPALESPQKTASWIRDARAGDEAAFESLVKVYYGPLFHVLRPVLPTQEDVEEVLQDAFYRFYLALPRFREDADPFPFLRTTALRRAYTHLKKHRIRLESLEHLSEGGVEIPSGTPSPDPAVLQRWASRLSPRRRMVFLLRELGGMADEAIAKELGIRCSTVRRHAQMALAELRRSLEEGDL
ncbi:MAG: sigma-70 family RNA polymerase sigma factor [Acidobacteriota bacterium]